MKPEAFEVDYTRADEPENNYHRYHRVLPPDLFKSLYTFVDLFAARANVGDSMSVTLGLENWTIKAIGGKQ